VAPSSGASPQEFFDGHPLGLAAFDRVLEMLGPADGAEVRVTTSQVAFQRTKGFAHLWLPGRYLALSSPVPVSPARCWVRRGASSRRGP
jgi:hypothetical protein